MTYRIELYSPFLHRNKRGRMVRANVGSYLIPDEMPDAAAHLAVAQGIAKIFGEPDPYKVFGITPPPLKFKREYTQRKKPAPSNKMRNVPANKSALAEH
jgi:hypothetical protein